MEREREPVFTKRFVLEHTEEDVIDLSLCNLTKVPVKELVSGIIDKCGLLKVGVS